MINVTNILTNYFYIPNRVVNVSSVLGNSALNKCATDLKTRFTSGDIEMSELETLMKKFEEFVYSVRNLLHLKNLE